MTDTQKSIVDQVNHFINNGQGLSLLEKLGFELTISESQELNNYILVLILFIENKDYSPQASELLLKQVLLKADKWESSRNNKEWLFQIMFDNKILPYTGLSELIRRLLATVIYKREKEQQYVRILPDKAYLSTFNINLLIEYTQNQSDATNALTLLYNCWESVDADHKISLNQDAIQIFRNFLLRQPLALEQYLRNFIRYQWYGGSRHYYEGKLIVPEPFYIQIFGSTDSFFQLITKFDESLSNYNKPKLHRLCTDIRRFLNKYVKFQAVTFDDPEIDLDISLHQNLTSI